MPMTSARTAPEEIDAVSGRECVEGGASGAA